METINKELRNSAVKLVNQNEKAIYNIDPDYLIALYLKNKIVSIEEQQLMNDLQNIVEQLWIKHHLSVKASFQENACDKLVSPEVVSSLKRLKNSGLIQFEPESEEIYFRFIELSILNDSLQSRVLESHKKQLGDTNDKILEVIKACEKR